MRRQAVLNRADILAALAEYAARQYPDAHLNPGYEFDQGDNKWILGLSLELPLRTPNGGLVKLSQVADVTQEGGAA